MKIFVFSSESHNASSKMAKAKKFLEFLYRSADVQVERSKLSTSKISNGFKKGYKYVDVSGKKPTSSLKDKVVSVSFDLSADRIAYDILSYMGVGIADKAILESLKLLSD